jgi:hypothetical protein
MQSCPYTLFVCCSGVSGGCQNIWCVHPPRCGPRMEYFDRQWVYADQRSPIVQDRKPAYWRTYIIFHSTFKLHPVPQVLRMGDTVQVVLSIVCRVPAVSVRNVICNAGAEATHKQNRFALPPLRVSGVSAAAAAAARAFRTAHDIVTPSRHAHGDERPSSYGALDSKLIFDPETQVPM